MTDQPTANSGEQDIEVVGEARDGLEAVAKATRFNPTVVLMDIRMEYPAGSGYGGIPYDPVEPADSGDVLGMLHDHTPPVYCASEKAIALAAVGYRMEAGAAADARGLAEALIARSSPGARL